MILKFDDFASELQHILNGAMQGCPLSMVLFTFYNTPFIDVATKQVESSIGFVEDTMLITTGKTIDDCHSILKDMMECDGGGFTWSHSHNSQFELTKLACMDFPAETRRQHPPPLHSSNLTQSGLPPRKLLTQ